MTALIEMITPVVNYIFTTIGTIASTISTTPILALTVGFLVVGGAVGIFGRLLSRN